MGVRQAGGLAVSKEEHGKEKLPSPAWHGLKPLCS